MPAESRPHQVAAHCGDPKALVRFSDRGQQSGNQSRARQTRRVPVEQEQRPRNRDDCVVPGAGLRDNIIAGPIIMPVYVYLPLQQKTFLDLRVIMRGAGSTRFHAEQSGTLAGRWVDAQHLQLYARRDIEPYPLRSATRHRGSAANTTLNR